MADRYVDVLRRERDELQRALNESEMSANARVEVEAALAAIKRAIGVEMGATGSE